MKPWTIDDAGIVRDEGGHPIAALEPELPLDITAAILAAPMFLEAKRQRGIASAAEIHTRGVSPDRLKTARDLADTARTDAHWATKHADGAFDKAKADALNVPVVPTECDCRGACGEAHHGLVCRAPHGYSIHRPVEAPGMWVLLSRSGRSVRDGPPAECA
ncbi:MAG TPA: hypothetical protein VN033_08855 [Vulgatibacter sp.]|nr:hypothetical protein [Vulgatibacter sp.]